MEAQEREDGSGLEQTVGFSWEDGHMGSSVHLDSKWKAIVDSCTPFEPVLENIE